MALGDGPNWWQRYPQVPWNYYWPPTQPGTWASASTSTFVMVERFHTWTEAIAVASAAHVADGRVSVRREGDRWAVRWKPRMYLVNGGAA